MAKVKVVHSEDAATIIFEGNPAKPEPSQGIIKFPGGFIEVSRTTDGSYWVHIGVDSPKNIRESRIDYNHEGWKEHGIPDIPGHDKIQHLALRIYRDKKEV